MRRLSETQNRMVGEDFVYKTNSIKIDQCCLLSREIRRKQLKWKHKDIGRGMCPTGIECGAVNTEHQKHK